MTGLEKMINDIQEEAKKAADEVIKTTNKNAKEIIEEAKKSGDKQRAEILKQSDADIADYLSRAKSAAVLQKRKNILSAKQEIINEVIDHAQQSFYDLSDEEYFEIILKMINKYALPQKGEICFSADDLKRIPSGFEKTINRLIGDKNAELVISKSTKDINGGFILIYGGVEENCSISALFDSAREILQDEVNEVLFK